MKSHNSYRKENEIRTKVTSVWFEEDEKKDLQIHYCSQCRMPVFQFQGGLVMEIPGDAPSSLPFYVECRNRTCGRKYKIHLMLT